MKGSQSFTPINQVKERVRNKEKKKKLIQRMNRGKIVQDFH